MLYTDSDRPFDIFKLFLSTYRKDCKFYRASHEMYLTLSHANKTTKDCFFYPQSLSKLHIKDNEVYYLY